MGTDGLLPVIPGHTGMDGMLVSSLIGNVTGCIEALGKGATEREMIRSRSRTIRTMLRERHDAMVGYLNLRFGERGRLYDGYFSLIDRAMESGNDDVVRLALESLLQVYTSPLSSDGDSIMEQFGKMSSALGE